MMVFQLGKKDAIFVVREHIGATPRSINVIGNMIVTGHDHGSSNIWKIIKHKNSCMHFVNLFPFYTSHSVLFGVEIKHVLAIFKESQSYDCIVVDEEIVISWGHLKQIAVLRCSK